MTSWRAPGFLRRQVFWLGSATLVCVMVLAAVALGRASLHSAMEERLTERTNLLHQLLEYADGSFSPASLAASAARVPFSQIDPARNRQLLASFMVGPTGDAVGSAVIYRIDGTGGADRPTVDSQRPAAAVLPSVADLGDAWRLAAEGAPARSTLIDYQGGPALALAVPVGGLTKWGVLVVTQPLGVTSAQRFMHDLGSLGKGEGGISLLDRSGRVGASWDTSSLGRELLSPAEVSALSDRSVRRSTVGSGDAAVATIVIRRADFVGVFQQPTRLLFADLEAGQRQRDRALLGVLLLALGGVLTISLRRVQVARRDRARMNALLAGAHDLILVVGTGGRLTFVSPNLTALLGQDAAEWTGGLLHDHLHPDDVPRLERLLADPDGLAAARDVRFVAPDGGVRWFDVQAGDVSGEQLLRGVLLTCRDTGQRKDLEDRLLEQSRRDPLTGLANRAVLTQELDRLMALRGTLRPALLFLDLDGFKQVNDEQGHDAGDRVLVEIGERLRRLARDGDLVVRYGGDEFAVLLATADEATARAAADAVLAALRRPVEAGTRPAIVGASIGIAPAGADTRSAEDLIAAADAAMYAAKRAGGGAVLAAPGAPVATTPGHGVPAARSTDDAVRAGGDPAAPDLLRPPRRSRLKPAAGRVAPTDTGTLLAVLATVIAIVAVAGIGLTGAVQAQRAAERQRVSERLDVTARVADYAAALASPDRLGGPVDGAPWQLDGSVVDDLVLQAVLQSKLGGTGAQAALYRTDGDVLTGEPGGVTDAVRPGTAAFSTALAGHVGFVPLLRDGGLNYSAYAVPISRGGRVVAVLAVGQRLTESISQHLLELVGSLGFGEGGVSSVLPDGQVTHSWNPDLIGTRLVPADDLAPVRNGTPARVEGLPGQITLAARMDVASDGYGTSAKYIVLDQPTQAFYAGIRDSGLERNIVTLGGVLLCLLVVGLGGLHRGRQEQRARRRLNALLRNAHDIVMVLHGRRVGFISSAVEQLLARPAETCFGADLLDLVHPDDRARIVAFLAGEAGDSLQDVRMVAADGSASWFDVHRTDLTADRDLRGVVLTCQEIGERKGLRDRLDHLAHHDGLTGLPNRARFLQELDLHTRDGLPCTVLFVDLDRFKPVNDRHGHEAGDDVLREIARRLPGCVLGARGAVTGRLGGDEFAILLPGADAALAEVVADRVVRAVAEPIMLAGAGQVEVGATVGIALGEPGLSASELLRRADAAMYRGKDSGRGRYAVHAG